MKNILLITLILSIVNSCVTFTILDPITGRVKTDLKELEKNNEALKIDPNMETPIEVNKTDIYFKQNLGEEYLDKNKRPLYKIFNRYPYSHGR